MKNLKHKVKRRMELKCAFLKKCYLPVEPNPPTPRTVSESSST